MDFSKYTEKLDEQQQRLFSISIFILKLLLAGIILQLILLIDPDTYTLQLWLATLTTQILALTGIEAVQQEIFVILETATYEIDRDCLGWKSKFAFIALIFSASSLRENYEFILKGLIILTIANIIRIITTISLSHHGIISFELIHDTLWRWGLIVVVLILWIYWFNRQENLKVV